MVKFSIIIPVYNVEEYIANCLESCINQTFKDFEIIVVNDGSPDNSQSIIDEFVKSDKRIKSFIKKNGGLSDARNYGVKKSSGEYLVFLDSDDSINKELLENINKVLDSKPDIVRYQVNKIDQDKEYVELTETFKDLNGYDAFTKLMSNSWFVTANCSAYRREFFVSNSFSYAVGKIHEDYGLTPIIYIKAKKVTSISYVGYNYYYRENSITTDTNIDKMKKRNEDCLFHFDQAIKKVKDKDISKEGRILVLSYMANGLIGRVKSNSKEIVKEYKKELKLRDLSKYLIADTLPRKIKKLVYKISISLYMFIFVR